jgi:hypothetical protein
MVFAPLLLGGLLTIAWPTLPVRVSSAVDIPSARLAAARRAFERILLKAGVVTEWRYCGRTSLRPALLRPPSCEWLLAPAEVVVRIVRETPGDPQARSPLGFAYVDGAAGKGVLATVFINRLEALARRAGADPGELLGRTMAHEAGHLLLGTTSHSPNGLMRAEWREHEVRRNAPADWEFLPNESAALQQKFGDQRLRSWAP